MTKYVFSQLILNWYHINGRKNLPWQKNKTLYTVWISEVMLQQTTVNAVIPYFKKFMSRFPNIKNLSKSSLDDILYLWSGLGYYARAINIYKSAKIIKNKYNNKFPEQFSEVIKLPGIGKTTAGAILSLSLNFFFPILDGNIKRIIRRYYGIETLLSNAETEKKLWKIIQSITPIHHTNKFNQGMMDIGSLLCKPISPKCDICPLNRFCIAFKKKNWRQYTIHKKKNNNNKKKSWFVIIKNDHYIWLERNIKNNIWKNLFCFPNFEKKNKAIQWLKENNIKQTHKRIESFFHEFSHFKLHIQGLIIELSFKKNIFYNNQGIWYNIKKPQHIGLSHPIQKIINNMKI
ncbi:A/G-specific adenine glycosylase [Buchnera aphidicola]|uniref:A/G-specific adenine glycosylase n=1 Tax=Buchnera aphidicola TaxID=9 RepID=UPI0034642AA0